MAKVKILTVVSNSSGRVAHYTIDGKGASKRFPVETTDEEIKKALIGAESDSGDDNPDSEFEQLMERAKELGVKSAHLIKKKETLLAKIAEAEEEAEANANADAEADSDTDDNK